MLGRWLLFILVLLGGLATGVAWLNVAGEAPIAADAAPSRGTAEQVARGEYLVRVGNCMTCHTARGWEQCPLGGQTDVLYVVPDRVKKYAGQFGSDGATLYAFQ